MTIDEATGRFFQYLRVEKGLGEMTLSDYQEDLLLFFRFFKDKQTTDDLHPSDISDFMRSQAESEKAVPTILRRLSSTRSFYDFLLSEGIVSEPLPKFEGPKLPKKLPVVLSEEEVDHLLEAPDMTKESGIRDRAMLETMYASGLRVSELVGLRLSSINKQSGILTIYGKGNKPAERSNLGICPRLPREVHCRPEAEERRASHALCLPQSFGQAPLADLLFPQGQRLRRGLGNRHLRLPSHVTALLRHPSPRKRSRTPRRAGNAGARQYRDHPDLHPGLKQTHHERL